MWSGNHIYKGVVTKILDVNYLFILQEGKLLDGIEILNEYYNSLTSYTGILVNASFCDGTEPIALEPLLESKNFQDIFIKLENIESFDLNIEDGFTVEYFITEEQDVFINFLIKSFEERKNNIQNNGTLFTNN